MLNAVMCFRIFRRGMTDGMATGILLGLAVGLFDCMNLPSQYVGINLQEVLMYYMLRGLVLCSFIYGLYYLGCYWCAELNKCNYKVFCFYKCNSFLFSVLTIFHCSIEKRSPVREVIRRSKRSKKSHFLLFSR